MAETEVENIIKALHVCKSFAKLKEETERISQLPLEDAVETVPALLEVWGRNTAKDNDERDKIADLAEETVKKMGAAALQKIADYVWREYSKVIEKKEGRKKHDIKFAEAFLEPFEQKTRKGYLIDHEARYWAAIALRHYNKPKVIKSLEDNLAHQDYVPNWGEDQWDPDPPERSTPAVCETLCKLKGTRAVKECLDMESYIDYFNDITYYQQDSEQRKLKRTKERISAVVDKLGEEGCKEIVKLIKEKTMYTKMNCDWEEAALKHLLKNNYVEALDCIKKRILNYRNFVFDDEIGGILGFALNAVYRFGGKEEFEKAVGEYIATSPTGSASAKQIEAMADAVEKYHITCGIDVLVDLANGDLEVNRKKIVKAIASFPGRNGLEGLLHINAEWLMDDKVAMKRLKENPEECLRIIHELWGQGSTNKQGLMILNAKIQKYANVEDGAVEATKRSEDIRQVLSSTPLYDKTRGGMQRAMADVAR